jgi:hypothetical protein
MGTRVGIVAALGNYFLFFTPTLIDAVKGHQRKTRSRARLDDLRGVESVRGARPEGAPLGQRVCAVCGTREVDGADIRVCTCEKCQALGGPRTLCLAHARDH